MTRIINRVTWRWDIVAILAYALIAVATLDHGVSIADHVAGQGSDPYIFIWFLSWWPWAIANHQSLLHTGLLWQPVGAFTAWVTSVPLLSLVTSPITVLAGPVISYNLLVLAGPCVSGYAAYRLCLRITDHSPAALLGGFLYGFSPFEMDQAAATPNLSLNCLVPVLIIVALRRVDGAAGRVQTVCLMAAIVAGEFLISIEIFATMIIFGMFVWLCAYGYLAGLRPGLKRLLADAALAAPPVILALSPLLISMLTHPHVVSLPALWPNYFTMDAENILLPTPMTALGGHWLGWLPPRFSGSMQEMQSYVGLPLLLLVTLFAVSAVSAASASARQDQPTNARDRMLLVLLLVFLVLGLGPVLWVAGRYTDVHLPWSLFVHLPLLSSALPTRFAMYLALAASLIVSIWLAAEPGIPRYCLALLICASWWPAAHPLTKLEPSEFFQPGRVETTLGPNPVLLVLPFATQGPAMFWQAENHFGYRQSGGYLGFIPAAMQHYPAALDLFGGSVPVSFPVDLQNFCAATHTDFIVAGPGTPPALLVAIRTLRWPVQNIDDVVVFKVPPQPAGTATVNG